MISKKFAETLYDKMQEHTTSSLDSNELETLCKLMSSDVMLKAFGQAFAYCRMIGSQMTQLDLSEPGASVQYSRCQGQVTGINQVVVELLNLITEEEEEDVSA